MTIARYALIVWVLVMAASLAMVDVVSEMVGASGWKFAIGLSVFSAGVVASFARIAAEIPSEDRMNFWSYRTPNSMLAIIGAALVLAVISLVL